MHYIQAQTIVDNMSEAVDRMWALVRESSEAAQERARAVAPLGMRGVVSFFVARCLLPAWVLSRDNL